MASLKENWKTYNASVGLFIATVAWGASFFLIKKATAEVGVWPFLFWRFAFASLFMIVVFPRKAFKSNKRTIMRGFILGGLLFGAIFTQTYGLQMTTAGKSGFITALYVPLVPIFGWFFSKFKGSGVTAKVTYRHFVVAFVSLLGLYVLTDTVSQSEFSFYRWWHDANPGDIWTLGCALSYSLQIIYTERVTREEKDSVALGLWQFVACFLFISLGVSLVDTSPGPFIDLQWNPLNWSSFALASTLFNAVFSTCFGFIMQLICQKYLGALKAALIFALEAPLATIFAFLFMNEILTLKEFIGASIVFLVSIVPDRWLKTKLE